MGLYARLKGDAVGSAKLPIWPVINSFVQLVADEIDDATFVQRFALSAPEQAEFAQLKTQVLSEITADITSHINAGYNTEHASRMAKNDASSKYREILLRVEHGYYTESEFKTAMGIA